MIDSTTAPYAAPLLRVALGILFLDGGWEYPAFWAAALAVQLLLGNGAWASLPSAHLF